MDSKALRSSLRNRQIPDGDGHENLRVRRLVLIEDQALELKLALHEQVLRSQQRLAILRDRGPRLLDIDRRHEPEFHPPGILRDQLFVRGDRVLFHREVGKAKEHVEVSGHDLLRGGAHPVLPGHFRDAHIHPASANVGEIRIWPEILEQRLAHLDASKRGVKWRDRPRVVFESAANLRLPRRKGKAGADRGAKLEARFVAIRVQIEDHNAIERYRSLVRQRRDGQAEELLEALRLQLD